MSTSCITCCFVLLYFMLFAVNAQNDVVVDIDINSHEIHEGSNVSIQCTVTGLLDNDTVLIQQEVNGTDIKLMDWVRDGILSTTSTVEGNASAMTDFPKNDQVTHTLTFGAIHRSNAGTYKCHAIRFFDMSARVEASDMIKVTVFYLPSGHYPICSNESKFIVGTSIELTCSSEDAVPSISLHWSQQNSTAKIDKKATTRNDMLLSVLRINVTDEIDGAFFTCKILSSEFPNFEQQCSIGPVSVVNNVQKGRGSFVLIVLIAVMIVIFLFVIVVTFYFCIKCGFSCCGKCQRRTNSDAQTPGTTHYHSENPTTNEQPYVISSIPLPQGNLRSSYENKSYVPGIIGQQDRQQEPSVSTSSDNNPNYEIPVHQ